MMEDRRIKFPKIFNIIYRVGGSLILVEKFGYKQLILLTPDFFRRYCDVTFSHNK